MGIFTGKSVYAWYRNGTDRINDRRKAKERTRFGRRQRSYASLIYILLASYGQAETIKIATYHTELDRRGPGLLVRDILSGNDSQVQAVARIITHTSPDILLLNGFDYDLQGAALAAFADLLGDYPYQFALRPNTGLRSGMDLDGDGQIGGPGDAQGYGWFAGQRGMAILSRYPIDTANVQDFSDLKWIDFPDALLPTLNGHPFPSKQALAAQRLSTTGHWVVPVMLPDGVINLLAFSATPPVFDGPEDRNGKRNHDEVRFWSTYLNAGLDVPPLSGRFVVLGNANLDPLDGDGLGAAIRGLLAHPLVQDPAPKSKGALLAARNQGGANALHKTNAALDTVDWRDDPGPGNMRVDYVLPSTDLTIADAGVFWPADNTLLGPDGTGASRHRLVWVDVIIGR